MSRFIILEGHDGVGTTTLTNLLGDKYLFEKRNFQLSNKTGIYDEINEKWNVASCGTAIDFDKITQEYASCGKKDIANFKAVNTEKNNCVSDSNGILRMPSYISTFSPKGKNTMSYQELYNLKWEMPDHIEVVIILCDPQIKKARIIERIKKQSANVAWDDKLVLDDKNHYLLEKMDYELCNATFERYPNTKILDTGKGITKEESLYELELLLRLNH